MILYLTQLGSDRVCLPFIIEENLIVENVANATVKFYDYYNPEVAISKVCGDFVLTYIQQYCHFSASRASTWETAIALLFRSNYITHTHTHYYDFSFIICINYAIICLIMISGLFLYFSVLTHNYLFQKCVKF